MRGLGLGENVWAERSRGRQDFHLEVFACLDQCGRGSLVVQPLAWRGVVKMG